MGGVPACAVARASTQCQSRAVCALCWLTVHATALPGAAGAHNKGYAPREPLPVRVRTLTVWQLGHAGGRRGARARGVQAPRPARAPRSVPPLGRSAWAAPGLCMAGSSSMPGHPLICRPVLATRSLRVHILTSPLWLRGSALYLASGSRAPRQASRRVRTSCRRGPGPIRGGTLDRQRNAPDQRGQVSPYPGLPAERCCDAQTSTRGRRGARLRTRSSCSTRRSSLRAPCPPAVGSAGAAAAPWDLTQEWCCAVAGCLR